MTAITTPTDLRLPVARHEVLTPEGVPLVFTLASAGDRLAAFLWDLLLLGLLNLGVGLLMVIVLFGGRGATDSWLLAFALLFGFLSRTFYFVWFEIRRQGRTPGKRKLGLRVIDAAGGPLRPDAVLARNLTREVEILLPVAFLTAPEAILPGTGSIRLPAIAWAFVLAALPLFNRGRLRVGDLLAGTCVVREPRVRLFSDIAGAHRRQAAEAAAPAFSREQLDIYGIYELQVLEEVLRKANLPGGGEALATVAAQIRNKIGWPPDLGPEAPRAFLEAFYAAQRARLEQKMLLGRRQERKQSRGKDAGPLPRS